MSNGLIHSTRVIDLAKRSYSTSFSATENPISEGGNWINGLATGVDWGNMRSDGTKAYGTLATSLHDNTAVLTGTWNAAQYAQGFVYRGSPDGTYAPEVELRLRTAIAAHSLTGYEVNWGLRGGSASYLNVVRWNGAVTDFTTLLDREGALYEVVNGDKIRAEISGNIITVYRNDVELSSVDITSAGGTVYSSGAPGIGTNADTGGTSFLDQYGLTSFSAGDL